MCVSVCVRVYKNLACLEVSTYSSIFLLQEHQQLLTVYQNLVVKQLVSQSQSKKQEEVDQSEEQDEETRSVRNELMVLTPQIKDLVLAQKKNIGTED